MIWTVLLVTGGLLRRAARVAVRTTARQRRALDDGTAWAFENADYCIAQMARAAAAIKLTQRKKTPVRARARPKENAGARPAFLYVI
jgi:hypothetical protein